MGGGPITQAVVPNSRSNIAKVLLTIYVSNERCRSFPASMSTNTLTIPLGRESLKEYGLLIEPALIATKS